MMATRACQQYLMWHFIGADRQTGREREQERGAKRKLRVRFWNLQWSCNMSLAWLGLMSGCPPSWNAAFIMEKPLWPFWRGCLEQRRGVGGLPSSSHSGRAHHCCPVWVLTVTWSPFPEYCISRAWIITMASWKLQLRWKCWHALGAGLTETLNGPWAGVCGKLKVHPKGGSNNLNLDQSSVC